MSHGSALALSNLEILAVTGVGTSSGQSWDLIASGQVNTGGGSCANIAGYTRVFGGSNCSIGTGGTGPSVPDVFDVIPLPTVDLPGPPNDSAPEVITNCGVGSVDTAYDVNTGAQLGSNACGNNPPEQNIGNTNSNTLDYIPTPGLASFEEVGVVEAIPGSAYVSGTYIAPQLSNIAVSGNQATFTYYGGVVCQASSSDAPTISQFTYETPYADLNASGLIYATGISCPASGGSTSITVTFARTIPYGAGLRFKYDGYGPGHFIVGAPGSMPFATEREASEECAWPRWTCGIVHRGVAKTRRSARPRASRRIWRTSVGPGRCSRRAVFGLG